jgi:hypothetical protein
MKGLDLSRKYYLLFGAPMIKEQFPELEERIAVGLCGEGSECIGYDDDISSDHDFEPSFCMFLTDEDEEKYGFQLKRAYSKLPKEFEGYKRQAVSPAGGPRRGVIRSSDFYRRFTGVPGAPDNNLQWLYIPSDSLLEACNGEIWRDDLGEFSAVRNTIKSGYSEDIRLKKIAAHCVTASQAGEYNYGRLIRRGDTGAAQLAVFEYVKHIISVIYLLNNKYEPYYKWVYRGMDDLPVLGDLKEALSGLTELGNTKSETELKNGIICDISAAVIKELLSQSIADGKTPDLSSAAYSVVRHIKDPELRNMHIMAGA